MSDVNVGPIVVGIGMEGESNGALGFAIDEAIRQQCLITIVHASPETVRRHKVHALVEASQSARLVVVQHRDRSPFERVFTRSISAAVSARARCAVVTVPSRWDSGLHLNRITVGIDDVENANDALDFVFQNAERRCAVLDVIHALGPTDPANSHPGPLLSAEERKARATCALEQALAPWRIKYPRVRVERHVSELDVHSVLRARSHESDLLVLGQRRTRVPFRLGSVARSMVRSAYCPVAIIPHGISTSTSSRLIHSQLGGDPA